MGHIFNSCAVIKNFPRAFFNCNRGEIPFRVFVKGKNQGQISHKNVPIMGAPQPAVPLRQNGLRNRLFFLSGDFPFEKIDVQGKSGSPVVDKNIVLDRNARHIRQIFHDFLKGFVFFKTNVICFKRSILSIKKNSWQVPQTAVRMKESIASKKIFKHFLGYLFINLETQLAIDQFNDFKEIIVQGPDYIDFSFCNRRFSSFTRKVWLSLRICIIAMLVSLSSFGWRFQILFETMFCRGDRRFLQNIAQKMKCKWAVASIVFMKSDIFRLDNIQASRAISKCFVEHSALFVFVLQEVWRLLVRELLQFFQIVFLALLPFFFVQNKRFHKDLLVSEVIWGNLIITERRSF
ncbi:hypothetical protein HMPREF9439_02626 [Parasutterella excrementihominis YIT 11859]|uniref:Uncharacterized protein n=1 Tax=Parasutterella excrementihominis YIT 11859 TaxID=762966 RepID=F3QNU0_9BURK|nr:hypothetical protein HMPREF9439_02626 [Parasutterella excrementihominis YIT 11859]